MKVDIKKIAKESGFGVGTVSRALSANPYNVKDETRRKILEIARKHKYVKDITAKALVTGKSNDIGLIMPAVFESLFYNDYFIKLLSGVMSCASQHGYKVRPVLLSPEFGHSELIGEIKSFKLNGVIFASYCGNYYVRREVMEDFGVPVVVMNQHIDGNNISSVILDDFSGGYDGMSFLLGLGHKNVCVIKGVHSDMEERFTGCLKALSDHNMKIKEDLTLYGNAKEGSGFLETLKLLDRKVKVSAIFALNDEMAIGALRAVKKLCLHCPEDISILGFDGMDLIQFTDPKLSSMVRPVAEMGRIAVEILLEKRPLGGERCIKVKAELSNNESCQKNK